jgi:transposase InsO family protein
MPWKEVSVMDEKIRFIHTYLTHEGTFSSLCSLFGITPKTGYKYLKQYNENGFDGLKETSRRPKKSPTKINPNIESLIVLIRHLHPSWAGEKIKTFLNKYGNTDLPSEKTIDRILKRYGLITIAESEKHKPWVRFEHENPNDLWQIDFKGHFATRDQNRCYPLTLLDDHSRFSLLIRSCADQRAETVKTALIEIFNNYGLPLRMTMDNGSPWGYSGKQEHTEFS